MGEGPRERENRYINYCWTTARCSLPTLAGGVSRLEHAGREAFAYKLEYRRAARLWASLSSGGSSQALEFTPRTISTNGHMCDGLTIEVSHKRLGTKFETRVETENQSLLPEHTVVYGPRKTFSEHGSHHNVEFVLSLRVPHPDRGLPRGCATSDPREWAATRIIITVRLPLGAPPPQEFRNTSTYGR